MCSAISLALFKFPYRSAKSGPKSPSLTPRADMKAIGAAERMGLARETKYL